MTDIRRYVIQRAFVLPLGVSLLLLGGLIAVSIIHGQPFAKLLFLLVFALPIGVLFVECAFRSLLIDKVGVTSMRFGRIKRIVFSDVTSLESVQVRSRVFLTLSAGSDDFLIISNSYCDFPELVKVLVAALPAEVVPDETRKLANSPPRRYADIGMVWFVVVALVYVLIAQFSW